MLIAFSKILHTSPPRGHGPGRGGMSELAIVPVDFVQKFPNRISFSQACMLGTTYGTAHYALLYEAKLQAGEVCLVLAAGGALGLAACQVAKARGKMIYFNICCKKMKIKIK